MTQINSSKRLENEMILLEKGDIKTISLNISFIVKLTCNLDQNIILEDNKLSMLTENELDKLSDIVYNIITCDYNNKPSSVYVSLSEIILVFPVKNNCVENIGNSSLSEHICLFFGKINEFYVKNKGISLQNISGQIIFFSTQIHVISYIAWLITNNSYNYMKSISNNIITTKDIQFYTNNELEAKLKTTCGIDWETLSYKEKYGIIIKINDKCNFSNVRNTYTSDKYIKKNEILKVSELIDVKNSQKYVNLILVL